MNEAGAGVLDPEIWARLAPVIFPGMDETKAGSLSARLSCLCLCVLSDGNMRRWW